MDPASIRKIGKYEVTGVIGRGGMGVVYQAKDPHLDRRVAIKTITGAFSDDPDMLKRFFREAQSLGSLQHPNIVTVYDLGEKDGNPYFVMEFLEGESLDLVMSSDRQLSLLEKIAIIIQVCDGLGYAHRRGVVHRDIKPANIMISRDGGAKIFDFGIARAGQADVTRTGEILGSLRYMSPEQINSKSFDSRVDIFSTGVVLYQLITGHLPFDGNSTPTTLLKIVHDPPPPLSNFLLSYPPEMEPILLRALAKNPADRYQTAEEFAADLAQLLMKLKVESIGREMKQVAVLIDQGEVRQARDLLLGVLKIDPQHPRAKRLLHEVQQRIQQDEIGKEVRGLRERAEEAMADRQFSQALEQVKRALALEGENRDLLRLRKAIRDAAADTDKPEETLNRDTSERLPSSEEIRELVRREEDPSAVQEPKVWEAGMRPAPSAGAGEFTQMFRAPVRQVPKPPAAPSPMPKVPENQEHDQLPATGMFLKEALEPPAAPGQSPPMVKAPEKQEPKPSASPGSVTELIRTLAEQAPKPPAAPRQSPPKPNVPDKQEPNPNAPLSPQEQTEILANIPPTQILRADSAPNARPSFSGDAGVAAPGMFTELFSSPGGGAPQPPFDPPICGGGGQTPGRQLPPRVRLTFLSSSDPLLVGSSIPIARLPFVIGRSADADLSIPSEPALSKRHCAIDWKDDAYLIQDLESSNGTWVNGSLIRQEIEVLPIGARIRFSSSTLLTLVPQDVYKFPDLTGCVVRGRYKLLELIRATTKSALYRGEDLHVPQAVAIKILSPDLANYPGYLKQFTHNAELVARIRHPFIAKVLDHGPAELRLADGGEFASRCICMEYMEGGSLADRIGEKNWQEPAEVLKWLDPIVEALGYVHGKELVHGGLKTTSVVFDKESKAYLTDFAVATATKDNQRAPIIGAQDFMAPEQWERMKPTPLTDQYSLAALTYFALVGRVPFEGQSDPVTRSRNLERGIPQVHEEARRQGNPKVPESMSSILARGLNVTPEKRYPSVREFFESLSSAPVVESRRPHKRSVFISYRRDSASAWPMHIGDALERHDIQVYMDTALRDQVVRFPLWLEDHIRDCDVFLCLLSANTLDSEWVRKEIRLAWKHRKPMIPIHQEDFKFPDLSVKLERHIDGLLSSQGVPLLDRKQAFIKAAVEQLAEMIHRASASPPLKKLGKNRTTGAQKRPE